MGNKGSRPGMPPGGGGRGADGLPTTSTGAGEAASSVAASPSTGHSSSSAAASGDASASATTAAAPASSATSVAAASVGATNASEGGGGGGSSHPLPVPTKKATIDDFIMLKTVGRGSFGKVVMVRKKDEPTSVYAMKILKKEMVLKRKQYEHTLAERRILENIDHPFIVSLRFAFQSEHKLYMVFDFFNGGELYHYLSEGGRFTEDRAKYVPI